MKKIEFYTNKSLKNFCTFKIGGNAKYLFVVYSIKHLKSAIVWCKNKQIKFKVIGLGANLLFDDLGFDGAIIVNKTSKIKVCGNCILSFSGTTVAELIAKTKKHHLTGFEHFAGIPSTVGGAIVNNLGAWGFNIGQFVKYVKLIDTQTLKTKKLCFNQCNFGYRSSVFKGKNGIILSVKFSLKKAQKQQIESNLKTALAKKTSTQPTNLPSAGSVFKRTSIIPAKLIDELGLKGTTIGGAQISNKHAGFIVNIGSATSNDVKQLIKLIENELFLHYSATPIKEIEFVDY